MRKLTIVIPILIIPFNKFSFVTDVSYSIDNYFEVEQLIERRNYWIKSFTEVKIV